MNILFADDSESVRGLVSYNLQKQGHNVETVTDGAELLKELKSGETYDVVVTDNNMPGVKGIDVLRSLRANDSQFKDLPVIVYSGDSYLGEIVKELGGIFIDKLLSSGDLFTTIDRIAKKRR